MKKIFLMMALFAMPFMFFSCDNKGLEELTGNVSMTVGDQTISLPACIFVKQDNRVILTSTNLNHSIVMYVDAQTTGNYTLGVATTPAGLVTNMGEITNILSGEGNYLLYSPSNDIENNAMIVLVGSLTFSEFSSNKLVGSFSGMAVNKNVIADLDAMDIVQMFIGEGGEVAQITGTFTAVGKK